MTTREDRSCKKHGLVPHVHQKDGHSRCTKCNVDRVQKRREKIKIMAVTYKGGSCIKCGYNKCVAALEFHHRDPTQKDFAIGNKGYTRGWERVRLELDKCDLLCSNCHKELHSK